MLTFIDKPVKNNTKDKTYINTNIYSSVCSRNIYWNLLKISQPPCCPHRELVCSVIMWGTNNHIGIYGLLIVQLGPQSGQIAIIPVACHERFSSKIQVLWNWLLALFKCMVVGSLKILYIPTQYSCHGMACANICNNHILAIWITAKQDVHYIRITSEKFLVEWTVWLFDLMWWQTMELAFVYWDVIGGLQHGLQGADFDGAMRTMWKVLCSSFHNHIDKYKIINQFAIVREGYERKKCSCTRCEYMIDE